MFIEDLVEQLADYVKGLRREDRKFICSIARRTRSGKALTTRQSWAVIALLRERDYHRNLKMREDELAVFLHNPRWRHKLTESIWVPSEVRYLGDNCLAFRTSRSKACEPYFETMGARFIYGVRLAAIKTEKQLNAAIKMIGAERFSMDPATEQWLAEALDCVDLKATASATDDNMIADVPMDVTMSEWVHHVLAMDVL